MIPITFVKLSSPDRLCWFGLNPGDCWPRTMMALWILARTSSDVVEIVRERRVTSFINIYHLLLEAERAAARQAPQ